MHIVLTSKSATVIWNQMCINLKVSQIETNDSENCVTGKRNLRAVKHLWEAKDQESNAYDIISVSTISQQNPKTNEEDPHT